MPAGKDTEMFNRLTEHNLKTVSYTVVGVEDGDETIPVLRIIVHSEVT